ncbi:hypothetical protein OKA04_04120 [Luteolibacter flavescens]|uniref:Uncharacterized protein n=1 Tax=Luteolibacter flavescens TaxID=1859460 RepID=A0ABT3FLQ1_9BACT|nr:hypothetical protein [Luteolibacter flavescens]MCW1883900.1 hypothetical protein [Luteolibacter flavescens]
MRPALALLSLIAATAAQAKDAPPPYLREKPQASLKSPGVTEASGLAISPTRADRMWILNDSGGTADLHRTDPDGADLGKVAVKGVKNVDWEDLSSFTHQGKPYLLIADTGDNISKRSQCRLHIVAEPKEADKEAQVAWTITFTYEDGPRDCEAVAVDEKAGKILLLSKRTSPPYLYELPLKPAGKDPQVARKVGKITEKLSAGMPPIPFGTQPTGLAVSADGRSAAVVTYFRVFLFPRGEGETWEAAFARPPMPLVPHRLRQAESVCFARDGSAIFVVSEGAKSPVVRYRRGAE